MLSQPHLAACSFFPAVQIDDLDSGLAPYARQPWTSIVEHRFTLERKRGLLGVYASHIRFLEGLQVHAHWPPRFQLVRGCIPLYTYTNISVNVRSQPLRFIAAPAAPRRERMI